MTIHRSSKNTGTNQAQRIRNYAWYFTAAWTLLLLSSAVFSFKNNKETLTKLAQSEARTAIERDILYRSWGSSHGGVYAPVTDKSPPNPYLAHLTERDISTPSGRKLTLINPAYMTRQVYELAKGKGTFVGTGHLTSLNPIRPENTPDPWERKALESFGKGIREVNEMVQVAGQPFMRLMRAFETEQSCLECHASQGYKVGDIRGGLSVTLPVQPLIDATQKQLFGNLAAHGATWLLGLGMAGLGTWQLVRRDRAQKQLEDAQASSLSMLNATLESTADGILVTDQNGQIARWNQKFIDLWRIPAELLNTQIKYPVTNHIKSQMTQPEEFYKRVMDLYNNPEESSIDTLHLVDGRFFRRFSQPQRIGNTVVGRVWSFSDITDQKRAEKSLEESNRKLEILSTTDGLTGIANRRCFDETLAQEYARHARSGAELSLILLDIDHFKAFNDCYGHVAGDACLRQLGRVMADNAARAADLPARYGGEEFACILPETGSSGAVLIAEKIRESIQNLAISHTGSSAAEYVTASLGVVTVTCTVGGSVVDIITQADDLLYQAKANGRNRVEFAATSSVARFQAIVI